jgi:hypothetical protein
VTEQEFDDELTALCIRAWNDGIPPDAIASKMVHGGGAVLANAIGIDRAVVLLKQFVDVLQQVGVRRAKVEQFQAGIVDGSG